MMDPERLIYLTQTMFDEVVEAIDTGYKFIQVDEAIFSP